MRMVITNDLEKCVGCNRCIRVCPIEEANIARVSGDRVAVEIDNEKCIACGACIAACPHDSRAYVDDTERFFDDLRRGVKISVFTAPAIKTNFNEWRQILSLLREHGVDKIFDVSLGADICTWAHIRYLQRNPGKKIITQPCPAIVNYILKHKTGLADKLSPVHSPMLCTAIYMRKNDKISSKIAAISPCIAKTNEFEATNIVDYNITFVKLSEYIKNHSLRLPHNGSDFDHIESGLGFLYPMPGGLKENVEHYLGKSVRIDKSEGQSIVYKSLDEYAEQPPSNLPVVFDVLNCHEGCNDGTGCKRHIKSIFEMRTILENARQKAVSGGGAERLEELYDHFDKTLKLEDYIRTYHTTPVRQIPISDSSIADAFNQLGKYDAESQNFNCGACGSKTCLDMARKIAKGVNTPLNCIEKAHRDITREHTESLALQTENVHNLDTIMNDIEGIRSIMEEIISNMGDVTSSIENFNKMTNDIQRIVMQINIIAINASIEAARAGEFGRAFKVVAEEVRNLANSSKDSVKDSESASESATKAISLINEMIEKISDSINDAHSEISLISEKTHALVSVD